MTSPTPTVLPVQSLHLHSFEELKEAFVRGESITFPDPVLARVELNFTKRIYPLGFPFDVSSNSEEALTTASDMWPGGHQIFDTQPIELEICVADSQSSACPPAPQSRIRRLICTNVADGQNFAISDAASGFSFIWMTQAAVAHPSYVRFYFLEACILYQLATRYTTPVHAACVSLDGQGILLCGDSGAGKSTLAYACARAGWTYVTDDGSFLVNDHPDCLVSGNSSVVRFRPTAEGLFPELSGRPIIQRAEMGKPSIEMRTSVPGGIVTSGTAQVQHILFINRHDVRHQELVPLPTEIARNYLLQRASAVPEIRERQTIMFDRLLKNGVYELRYRDLDWAIDQLRRLARGEP